MEEWKWDIWESESRAKRDELEEAKEASSVEIVDVPEATQAPDANAAMDNSSVLNSVEGYIHGFPANATKEEVEDFMDSLENDQSPSDIPFAPSASSEVLPPVDPTENASASVDATSSGSKTGGSTPPEITEGSGYQETKSRSLFRTRSNDSKTPQVVSDVSSSHEQTRQATAVDTHTTNTPPIAVDHITPVSPSSTAADQRSSSQIHTSSENIVPNTSIIVNMSSSSRISSFSSSSVVNGSPSHVSASIPLPHPPMPPVATGGESIYRTIMNRLTALEANHTLYARYVEEQTAGVRDMLKRLGEEVGRIEGIVSFLGFVRK